MNEGPDSTKGSSPDSGRTRRKDRPVTDNPDVHLDAPRLKVDELNLNLLGILNAEVKGLETELLLEADLENLVGLLRRVADALENDEDSASEMIESLGRAIRAATDGSYSQGAGNGGGSAKETLDAVKNALDAYDEKSSSENGQDVRHEVSENGDITRITLNETGEVLDEEVAGNVADLPKGRG